LRSDLRDWGEDLLSERRLADQGLFEAGAVRRIWYEHQGGRRNWDKRLWALLMFQAWSAAESQAAKAAPRSSGPARIGAASNEPTKGDRRRRS
jgi:hypothetical protein